MKYEYDSKTSGDRSQLESMFKQNLEAACSGDYDVQAVVDKGDYQRTFTVTMKRKSASAALTPPDDGETSE